MLEGTVYPSAIYTPDEIRFRYNGTGLPVGIIALHFVLEGLVIRDVVGGGVQIETDGVL